MISIHDVDIMKTISVSTDNNTNICITSLLTFLSLCIQTWNCNFRLKLNVQFKVRLSGINGMNVVIGLCLSQGGRPSPFDRNLGTKMAAKCAEKLIQQIQESYCGDGELPVDFVVFGCFFWSIFVYCYI